MSREFLSAKPLALALSLALGTVAAPLLPAQAATTQDAQQMNPFFSESPLPLHYPQFDKIDDAHFAPAFDRGMAEELREFEAIANNPEPATFENTIVAMEKTGAVLRRARSAFFNLNGTVLSDARRELQSQYSPKFAAHSDAIMLNPKLYARVKDLYERRDSLSGLDEQDKRLIERYHNDFVRAGAALSDAEKTRIKEINAEMARLGTQFSQNVLNEVNDSAVLVDSRAELAGLTDAQIQAAAEAAREKGHDGKFLITLLNTTGQPPLAQLENRALRQRIHEASVNRGSRGNQYDNREIVSRVTKLRAERAAMMGFPNFAAFNLQNETAGTPEAVAAMLGRMAPAAVANARREAADLQKVIDAEQAAKGEPTFQLEPWDWAYYAEKVRQERFNFDESQLKPYLEMINVLENGVFHAATELYGITFKERTDLPKYHPDTWVYDVLDHDGSQLAIFIFDPYARSTKRGGAWMNTYVAQSDLTGFKPVVANHQNITKPPAGEPTLLTWDEVTTMFHEFGHGLHGFFQDVKYPYFSMRVPRDFVEYPSQVNEMWADWPSVLANYAKHHQTGAAMPQDLLDKVQAAANFNEGFRTTEYLGSAMLDQQWHNRPADQLPDADGVMAFEAAAQKADGTDYAPVPPRYRTPYFSHIMGGYAAGYYAYIWSEILDANTVDWVKANGGLTRANGDAIRSKILAPGGSRDPAKLYTDLSGGVEARIEPLLIKRGLAPANDGAAPPEGSGQ
ncbi:MAG: M3 family metallopeptidase [Pseudoxanthomonas suwonensis]|nr:M3 family metallopeptidase [Pseudoxanthomonas suwonensis]